MLRWVAIVVIAVSAAGLLGQGEASADLGDSAADLVYTPVTQCTVVNTQMSAGGPITPGFPQNFVVSGTQGFEVQGGKSGGCGVPAGATAAVLNLVALNAGGAGDLRVWPFGGPEPPNGLIYFDAAVGLNLANGAVVRLCDPATIGCTFAISVDADTSASDLIVDVIGFFQSTAPRRDFQVCNLRPCNTFLGANAGNFRMTGSGNTATGVNALQANTTGNANTATGNNALFSNTTGISNTASGASALQSNTIGSANTANGSDALLSNTTGSGNTATGLSALASNATGNSNTANGAGALQNNTTGSSNTGSGGNALSSNTIGSNNTASGLVALGSNTIGIANTATGFAALFGNTTGSSNTASGGSALFSNTGGSANTAVGVDVLHNSQGSGQTAVGGNALFHNSSGDNNTAMGFNALNNLLTGSSNIALGNAAGFALTGGSNNIYIGSNAGGTSESGSIRIGTPGIQTATFVSGIFDATIVEGASVFVDNNGQLGTTISSRRFKEDIDDLGAPGDRLLQLRPVTFRYTTPAADGSKPRQYGLVAEEVAAVVPELVVYGPKGEPYAVRYDLLSVLLLAELQRQHRELEALRAQIKAWGRPQSAATKAPAAGRGTEPIEPASLSGVAPDQQDSHPPARR